MRRTSLFIATLVLLSAVTAATAAEVVIVKPAAGTACTNPVWSPDGKSIAYVCKASDGTSSVNIATPAGGAWKTRVLLKNADSPAWSPDSKQIACHSGGLVAVDVASGKTQRLTTDKDGNTHAPTAWAPNGRYLLYAVSGEAGTTAAVFDVKAVKNISSSVGEGGAWTNAGKLITWQSGETPTIKLIDLAAGSSKMLLQGSVAARAFVPKGDAFAYVWLMPSPARGEGIYKIDLKKWTTVKCLALRSQDISWSKDGAQFTSVSKLIPKPGAEPEMNLYLGNTKNWAIKVVSKGLQTPAAGSTVSSWSPDGKSIVCAGADGGIKIVKL